MGAQVVILRDEREVLLVRHTYRPGWHFPGGGVEKNETTTTAVIREMHEEAGIKPCSPPELYGLYTNFVVFPSDHIALFIVRDWTQPKIPSPNHEIAEQRFFPVDALPEDTMNPVKRRLAEILNNAPRSELW